MHLTIQLQCRRTSARAEAIHRAQTDIAVGTVVGLGALGYELALQAAIDRLARS